MKIDSWAVFSSEFDITIRRKVTLFKNQLLNDLDHDFLWFYKFLILKRQILRRTHVSKICFIILKAHEFHAKEEVVIPEQPISPADGWALQVLANHRDDPCYQELKYLIDSMDEEEQVNLVALMRLGRGGYSADEWEQALADARSNLNDHTAEYIIGTPLVADYLEEGFSALGYSCAEGV